MSNIASIEIKSELPPLRLGPDGAIRVGETRITLDVIVQAFENGSHPDEIADDFDFQDRSEVYSAIAFYLRHKPAVQDYLDERQRHGEELKKALEAEGRTPSEEQREAIKLRWNELTMEEHAPAGQ